MDEVEVQWRVTWFPPTAPFVSKSGINKAAIREVARINAEHHPIIESREVRATPWLIVENLADE